MSNKITTMGYFVKRLRDCGYYVDRMPIEYHGMDPRAWTVVIDPGLASIMCTCYINHADFNDNYFEMYDGGQFIPGKFNVKTSSIEVLIEYLNKFNVPKKVEPKKEEKPTQAT